MRHTAFLESSTTKAIRSGVMALALGVPGWLWADEVGALHGQVTVVRGSQQLAATNALRLEVGDQLVSQADAEAVIRFDDGARLALRPKSHLRLASRPAQGLQRARRIIELTRGRVRYVSAKLAEGDATVFETATATIGIRGTDIEIAVQPEPQPGGGAGTLLLVKVGVASLKASDGSQIDVSAGQVGFGAEADLQTRGFGARRRPAARLLMAPPAQVFAPGALDDRLQ